jgi:hypothetical protein
VAFPPGRKPGCPLQARLFGSVAARLRARPPPPGHPCPARPAVAARCACQHSQAGLRPTQALAARRFHGRAGGRGARRCPEFVAISVVFAAFQLQDRLRLQGGVHNAARYECFPLDPSTGRLQAFNGRRTQENGGEMHREPVTRPRNPHPMGLRI